MSTPKKNVTTIRLAPGVATRRSYNIQKHTTTERRRLFEAVLVLDLDALGHIAARAALSKGLQSSIWGGAIQVRIVQAGAVQEVETSVDAPAGPS